MLPMWLPGIKFGPPHIVQGVGYFGTLVYVRNNFSLPNFLYLGFPFTTPSCNKVQKRFLNLGHYDGQN